MIEEYLRTARPAGKKGDGSKLYNCPVCQGRKKLEVHHDRPLWYCHKCGRGGRTTETLPTQNNVQVFQPKNRVLHDDHLERYALLPSASNLQIRLRVQRNLFYLPIGRLRAHSGPDPYRVYFPCYDRGSGIPCTFIGYLLTDGEPKYLFPSIGEGKRASEVLWGMHRLRAPVKNLTVVEGCFDAVHYPNTVALLGSVISQSQCEIIRSIAPKSVTIWLDEDAREKQAKVIEKLSQHISFPIHEIDWSNIGGRMGEPRDPDDMRNPRLLKLRTRIV